MPYAVFIRGGYAIHGTGQSNWPNLGKTASHGCIRLHPDNAFIFNRFVRAVGVAQAWVSVE
jgi:lipoprotein-anchoring transpeptidase ErfK/SrfK